jgi:TolB protein
LKKHLLLMILIWLLLGRSAWAELIIEITQGLDNPTSIAVVPFEWNGFGLPPEDMSGVIESDLLRSGQFSPVARADMLGQPQHESEVYYRDWRALNVEYLLIGRISGSRILAVEYELYDVYKQERILKLRTEGALKDIRMLSHRVSDTVYQQLTGIRGAFATKLLYISVVRQSVGNDLYRLMLTDSDGARAEVILEQREPILTPTWSPDGENIAYVSFETTRPAIYVHNLRTGRRERLTNFKGLNGAPSWSPDGNSIAMVLSKDGSPDIYVMDLSNRRLTRITRHYAIETEPAWMPDGKSLVFTSDRGGRPQIYQVVLASGQIDRLTYEGTYNARARVSPDGRSVVMVHRRDGEYRIAIKDLKRDRMQILTGSILDESPSIAPNGGMLLYATKYRGKGILAAVSLDGGVKFRLPSKEGDVREPAWSPFLSE